MEKEMNLKNSREITHDEWVTILVALRNYQECLASGWTSPEHWEHFDDETVTPLTIKQIDDLCESINFG
jgi:hypothetical protein